jgi:hypothetical protein
MRWLCLLADLGGFAGTLQGGDVRMVLRGWIAARLMLRSVMCDGTDPE